MQEGHGGWNPKMAEVREASLPVRNSHPTHENRQLYSTLHLVSVECKAQNALLFGFQLVCPVHMCSENAVTSPACEPAWLTETLYYISGSGGCFNKMKANGAFTFSVTAAKGNVEVRAAVEGVVGGPGVTQPIYVCSTFVGSGWFIE